MVERNDDEDRDDFVADRDSRKKFGSQKRKNVKSHRRDGEKRIHRVGASKERWKFDPDAYVGDEDGED